MIVLLWFYFFCTILYPIFSALIIFLQQKMLATKVRRMTFLSPRRHKVVMKLAVLCKSKSESAALLDQKLVLIFI